MISRAARRVDDFGMELQAEKFLRAVFNRGVFGIFRDGDGFETVGNFRELVAVGIPDLQRLRQFGEQRAACVLHRERAFAVFALLAFLDLAAEKLREQLHAEADAQHRHAELENIFVRQRRVLRINARRPAGQNDAARLHRGDFGGGRVEAEDGGIDVALAHAPGDDLRVLRTEIQDDNFFRHDESGIFHAGTPHGERKMFLPWRFSAN